MSGLESTLEPLCHRSKMYRIVLACDGVPADVGAIAAWPVYVNFPEARQW